jgi:hypothetical protein
MATGRRTWQQFEERAAAFFGSKRQVLSGSANRKDLDGSDSMHPRLHIEAKLREKHGVFRILDLARVAAMKAGWALQLKGIKVQKKVVLCLQEKGKPGFPSRRIGLAEKRYLVTQADVETYMKKCIERTLKNLTREEGS